MIAGKDQGTDEHGRIVEFQAMIHPLQALNTVHERMRAAPQARSDP